MRLQACYDFFNEASGFKRRPTREIDPAVIGHDTIADAKRLCEAPVVSVLIRAHNCEATIERCLRSVLEQETDFPFEVIVNDDCATDGTLTILKAWQQRRPDRLCVLHAHTQGGLAVADALNHAHARGAWIAECDGDDFWVDPHKLQAQLDLVRRHDAVLCVTNFLVQEVGRSHLYAGGLPAHDGPLPAKTLSDVYFQTNTLFYSRAVYERMVREIPLQLQGDSRKPACFARYGRVVLFCGLTAMWHTGRGSYTAKALWQKRLDALATALALFLHGPREARTHNARAAFSRIARLVQDVTPGGAMPPDLLRAARKPILTTVFRLLLARPTPFNLACTGYICLRLLCRRRAAD